jgi:hypothetical protein
MTELEKMELYLMNETQSTLVEIKEAYEDRVCDWDKETYEEWLEITATVNGYKRV